MTFVSLLPAVTQHSLPSGRYPLTWAGRTELYGITFRKSQLRMPVKSKLLARDFSRRTLPRARARPINTALPTLIDGAI
jgi:hypothetical protein